MFAALAALIALVGTPIPSGIPTYGPVPETSASAAAERRMPMPAPTGPDVVMIVNSGSTNTAGYTLRVERAGTVTLIGQDDLPAKKTVDPKLVAALFNDLKITGPLSKMATARCMKSASFGTVTHVAYQGEVSPDISCPANAGGGRQLEIDTDAIVQAAGVARLPSRARRAL